MAKTSTYEFLSGWVVEASEKATGKSYEAEGFQAIDGDETNTVSVIVPRSTLGSVSYLDGSRVDSYSVLPSYAVAWGSRQDKASTEINLEAMNDVQSVIDYFRELELGNGAPLPDLGGGDFVQSVDVVDNSPVVDLINEEGSVAVVSFLMTVDIFRSAGVV